VAYGKSFSFQVFNRFSGYRVIHGPLIKSEATGVAQVIEDMGNPFSFLTDPAYSPHSTLFQFIALHTVLPHSLTL